MSKLQLKQHDTETYELYEGETHIGTITNVVQLHDICIQIRKHKIPNAKLVASDGEEFAISVVGYVEKKHNKKVFPAIGTLKHYILFLLNN